LLPTEHNEITYTTFSIPITRSLKTQFHQLLNGPNYSEFYQHFYDAFIQQCAAKNLHLAAMVANGTMPIIRNSKTDNNDGNQELQKLSFITDGETTQYSHYWHDEKLVESLHFVIVASEKDEQGVGHGRFMNQVENMIRTLVEPLAINKERQDLTVRFFQHINHYL